MDSESSNDTTRCIEIDFIQPLIEQAQTSKQEETSQLRAHGQVQWLLSHHFPAKIRKSPLNLQITSPERGNILIKQVSNGETQIGEGDDKDGTTAEAKKCDTLLDHDDGPRWIKGAFQALKKILVEDLGNMNATDLQASIPEEDSDGRGMSDLRSLEKKLSVKVVFDDVTGHVLLVGDAKKMEKKVFVIRNMLSHYHWRLLGLDVAFDKAVSFSR